MLRPAPSLSSNHTIVYYTFYLFATKCLNPTQKSDKSENNFQASSHTAVIHYESSPKADGAFPQLLTSLSMAKEKYDQLSGVLPYGSHPIRKQPGDG